MRKLRLRNFKTAPQRHISKEWHKQVLSPDQGPHLTVMGTIITEHILGKRYPSMTFLYIILF